MVDIERFSSLKERALNRALAMITKVEQHMTAIQNHESEDCNQGKHVYHLSVPFCELCGYVPTNQEYQV